MSKTTFVRVLSRSLSFYWTGLGFAVKVVVEGTYASEGAFLEECLCYNLDEQCLEDTDMRCTLPTPWGGTR